jgi:hypothetical protein
MAQTFQMSNLKYNFHFGNSRSNLPAGRARPSRYCLIN